MTHLYASLISVEGEFGNQRNEVSGLGTLLPVNVGVFICDRYVEPGSQKTLTSHNCN